MGGLTALPGRGPGEAALLRPVQATLNSRGPNRNSNWTSPSPSLRRTWTTARQSSRRTTAPATGAVLAWLRACPWLSRIWPWCCRLWRTAQLSLRAVIKDSARVLLQGFKGPVKSAELQSIVPRALESAYYI